MAAATDRGGTFYEGGSGERVLGSGIPMTPTPVGSIASIIKARTGTAATQLVEHGGIELDRPAVDWLPEVSETQVLDGSMTPASRYRGRRGVRSGCATS